jgi:hypothetical protein
MIQADYQFRYSNIKIQYINNTIYIYIYIYIYYSMVVIAFMIMGIICYKWHTKLLFVGSAQRPPRGRLWSDRFERTETSTQCALFAGRNAVTCVQHRQIPSRVMLSLPYLPR